MLLFVIVCCLSFVIDLLVFAIGCRTACDMYWLLFVGCCVALCNGRCVLVFAAHCVDCCLLFVVVCWSLCAVRCLLCVCWCCVPCVVCCSLSVVCCSLLMFAVCSSLVHV